MVNDEAPDAARDVHATLDAQRPAADRVSVTRRLLRLAYGERRRLALGSVALAIGSLAGLLVPQAFRALVDGALAGGTTQGIDRIAAWMALALIVQALASAARFVWFTAAGERVVTSLRRDLFEHLLRQEIGFFDRERTGDLLSRLTSDTATVRNAVSVNVSMALRSVATLLGSLAFLFWTSPTLTALMLLVVPPVALGAVVYGRKIRRIARDVQDAIADTTSTAEETLSGIRTVRRFTAEQAQFTRFDRKNEASFALSLQRIRLSGVFFGASSFAGSLAALVVLWMGSRMVVAGALSVGELSSFVLYTLFVAMSFGTLSDLWAEWARVTGAARRLFDLMDRAPTMQAPAHAVEVASPSVLTFDAVSFSYPTRPEVAVLDGLSFEARRGEVVALVGSSGAGKSTVAALAARLYDPSAGTVRLDGVDLRALDPEALRHHVGSVEQEPLLLSATIMENIAIGRPGASRAAIEQAAAAANATEFIERLPDGFDSEVGERGVRLSGGQRQRIAIARAVLRDPALLVLDEATSALDAESEHLVREALERLMSGRITLVIAHRLSTIRDADRVLVLRDGQVAESGTHDALMAEEGLYHQLVQRQFAG